MTDLNASPTIAPAGNNQSYKVDVEAFYNDFIQQIDAIRSHISTSKNAAQFKNFLNSLDTSNNISASSLLSQLVIDPNTSQETRCHAFYRMLGLPSFEPGGSFYSPGFIHASTSQSTINTLSVSKTKLNVAFNLFDAAPDLYTLMDNREIIANQYAQIFSVSDINASVLALSGGKVRNFSVLSNANIDPLDTSVINQTYSFSDTQNLTESSDLTDYQDSSGNIPTGKVLGFLKHRSHLLKPFMVDPRVDLTVSPPYVGSPNANDNTAMCKLVGASFPTDKSQHQYAENIYAPSPMIDTICRARLSTTQPTSTLSERWKNIMAYVQNRDDIKDPDLLAKVYQNPTQTPEDTTFLQYLNIMRSMMDILFEARFHIITDTETKYHWVPIPNKKGPEYGSTTQGIIIGDDRNTYQDASIAQKIVSEEINQITTQNQQNNRPDLGNFIDFTKITIQPSDQSTASFGDINQETLESMTNDRVAQTDAANDALQKIEIIMGEFSGLGMCDIVAVYLALWTIDKQVLVNMLDNGAFSRLYQDSTLHSEAVQARQNRNGEPTTGIIDTMKAFEQQVVHIYAIMDKLWNDRVHNSGTQTT